MVIAGLQVVTGGCKRLQGVTGSYKWSKRVTIGYRGLQEVTRDDSGLQGITRGYKGSKRVTGGYRGF